MSLRAVASIVGVELRFNGFLMPQRQSVCWVPDRAKVLCESGFNYGAIGTSKGRMASGELKCRPAAAQIPLITTQTLKKTFIQKLCSGRSPTPLGNAAQDHVPQNAGRGK